MFEPNLEGLWSVAGKMDIHSRRVKGPYLPVPFGPVWLNREERKTSVRADSSGSRGNADEVISDASILVPSYVDMNIDDRFEFGGQRYKVSGVHARYAVDGNHDHNQIMLEIFDD